MELYVALFSGLITALLLWWKKVSAGKRPPGPWGLPIFGYLPFLTAKPYLTLTRLAKRYGNVFSIKLGSINMLILNDFDSTREAFSQDAFIGRPPDLPFEAQKETLESGAFIGLAWKEQRRQCLHLLRDLGLGKSKMEEQLQEEINELLEYLEKNVNKPYCLRELLSPSTSNIIGSLMFGKRLKYDDPVRQMLTRVVTEGTAPAEQLGWFIFFPWLRRILKFLGIGTVNQLSMAYTEFQNYVMKEIEEHEKTLNPDNVRDFIDGYLLEIPKRKNDPSFNKKVLQDMVGAFFGAGSGTVRDTVEYLILMAATDQKAQKRIQKEIDEIIGKSRPPIWPDHKRMSYTDAFIMEVMRWQTLVPINLLRYTLTDTKVNGYFIPKHTHVISNHWAIHHDPEYWGPDADEFRVERFLEEDGNKVRKWEHYIPFSMGKRSCPGEPLGKVEIFLYFVSILQKFEVKMPGGKVADFEGQLGITLSPKPQEIILTKRN